MIRSTETLDQLCDVLEENYGDVYDACKRLGVSQAWLKAWCRHDPVVALAISEAVDSGAARLEHQAIVRATTGGDPDAKGSDSLLMFLLKGRKRATYGQTEVAINNFNVRELSDGDLEAKVQELSARHTPLLAPPLHPEDAAAAFKPVDVVPSAAKEQLHFRDVEPFLEPVARPLEQEVIGEFRTLPDDIVISEDAP